MNRFVNDEKIKNHLGVTIDCDDKGNVWRIDNQKSVACYISPSGYLRTSLTIKNEFLRFPVHRIVAIKFLGIRNMEINHIDKNKTNNALSNLEYVTRSQNCKGRLIERTNKVFSDKDIMDIRKLYKEGASIGSIARAYNVSHRTVKDRLTRDYCPVGRNRKGSTLTEEHKHRILQAKITTGSVKHFYDGVVLSQFCKAMGIKYASVMNRMKRKKESLEVAVQFYLAKTNQVMKVAA